MPSPARLSAYRMLQAIENGRADLPQAIARERERVRDDRDRALSAEIAAGTLRWRAALDHVIQVYARRPLARLDVEVLEVLRLSVYQLLHLDRVPASAVVDDAVEMVVGLRKRSAGGFVNGVLRTIARNRHRLPFPEAPRGSPVDEGWRERMLDYLGTTLSHPRWLVARWLDRHGADAARDWALFDNLPAPLTLRANLLKTTPEGLRAALAEHGVHTEPGRYAPAALVVVSGNPFQTPLARNGYFVVQDEASQLVAGMADTRPGERVLDACASPGGKTTAMAAAMEDRGLVVAGDSRPRRVELLRDTVATAGASIVRIVRADLAQPLPFRTTFDCVVVDAPCSGLGTIRRDPEIRWRRIEADLGRFAAAQRVMLDHAAEVVAPAGRLLYATCSSEPEENEEVVAAFLDRHQDFRPLDPHARPGLVAADLGRVVDERGHLRTYPHVHGLEAFFAALFERQRQGGRRT